LLLYLSQGAVLGLYAALTPGPFQAYLFAETLRIGWRRALRLALAPLFSDLPALIVIFLAISSLPDAAISVLRVVGGGFLLYLAWGTFQSSRVAPGSAAADPQAVPAGFWKAVLMNLLNPNVYIFWGTIGAPIVLEAWQKAPALALTFVATFYAILIPVTAGFIVLFGIPGRLKPGWQNKLLAGLSLLLLAMGVYQLWNGVNGLLG
jgi:threonine/homoserine/homoserine lactone efflux protein